jgi:hypothetical protein
MTVEWYNYSDSDIAFQLGKIHNSPGPPIYIPPLRALQSAPFRGCIPNNNNPVNMVINIKIRGADIACGFHTIISAPLKRENTYDFLDNFNDNNHLGFFTPSGLVRDVE